MAVKKPFQFYFQSFFFYIIIIVICTVFPLIFVYPIFSPIFVFVTYHLYASKKISSLFLPSTLSPDNCFFTFFICLFYFSDCSGIFFLKKYWKFWKYWNRKHEQKFFLFITTKYFFSSHIFYFLPYRQELLTTYNAKKYEKYPKFFFIILSSSW